VIGRVLLLAAALTMSAQAGAAAPKAQDKIIFISPLPFGVDVYLAMCRRGALMAGKALGVPTKIFESSDPETRSENLRAALNEGATIILVTGLEFLDIIPDVADDYPDVKFLMLDQCSSRPGPNIYCLLYKDYEANFLAGVEAGLTSRTGRIGTVGAADFPYEHRYSDSFAAGARYARPDIQVAPTLWIGGDNPWSDPLRAQSQASSLAADGVDRIMAAAAAGNGGIFKVASSTAGVMAFGHDINQCPESPGHILDNAVKHVDLAIDKVVEGMARGTQPLNVNYGLKEGAVNLTGLEPGLEASQCMIAQYPEVLKQVAEVRDRIASGELVVRDPAGIDN
jgi:basic membrane protein A